MSLILIILILNLVPAAAPSQQTECVAELVKFLPCLPFVSAPPDNFTAAVPRKCCEAITFLFNSTGSSDSCICYLLRLPGIFGFPLKLSRVLSLPVVCLGKSTPSLLSMCSSVEFSGESVSQLEEALQKCDLAINGTCRGTQCCHHLCAKQIPSAKNIAVSYEVVNGTPTCFCHWC